MRSENLVGLRRWDRDFKIVLRERSIGVGEHRLQAREEVSLEVRRAPAHILWPRPWYRHVLLDFVGYVDITQSHADHQEPALNVASGRVRFQSSVVNPLEKLGPCLLVLVNDLWEREGLVFPVCPMPDGERLEGRATLELGNFPNE